MIRSDKFSIYLRFLVKREMVKETLHQANFLHDVEFKAYLSVSWRCIRRSREWARMRESR